MVLKEISAYLTMIFVAQALEHHSKGKFKVVQNRTIVGISKYTINRESVIDCLIKCVQTEGCDAASFDMEVHQCTLELSGLCHSLEETATSEAVLKRYFNSENVSVCPEGWDQFQDLCYYFSSDTLPWPEAQHVCFSYGARLAEPRTINQLNSTASKAKEYDRSFWVGGSYDTADQQWKWQSTCGLIEHPNWAPGEPNGYGSCIQMWQKSNWTWDDTSCARFKNFLCQMRLPS